MSGLPIGPRILYCSAYLNGLDSLMFDGCVEERGLPSQTKAIKGLIDAGFAVTILNGMYSDKEINCNCEWLNKSEQLATFPIAKSIFQDKSPRNIYLRYNWRRLMRNKFSQMIQQGDFDFVYLNGEMVSSLAPIAAEAGIPCGQRAYGTGFGRYCGHSRFRLIKDLARDPYAFDTLTLEKDFVLATSDGSHVGNYAHCLCGNTLPYDFYDWPNGVDLPSEDTIGQWEAQRARQNYLFLGARLDYGKGHLFAVEVLEELINRGCTDLELVFAGEVSNVRFSDELTKAINEGGLEEKVRFLGPVSRSEVAKLHHNAVASFFVYGNYARGNSFLEGMAAGMCPVVLESDSSLSDLAIHGETALCVSTPEEAADEISALAPNKGRQKGMKAAGRLLAEQIIPSWDERIQREVELIRSYIDNRKDEDHE